MRILFTLLLSFFTLILIANPIAPIFISEFAFTDSTWTMEISDFYQVGLINLDGCCLESGNCISYFNSNITVNPEGVFVVNENDVQTPFSFDHSGELILFYSDIDPIIFDELSFGLSINPPYSWQSIVKFTYYGGIPPGELEFGIAKEGQPTIGYDPYQIHTSGFVEGYVYDSQMNPVENVHFDYGNYNVNIDETYTNENGYFSINLLGRNYNVNVHLAAIASIDTFLTIEPDSTYYFEFVFENYVHSDDNEIELPASFYQLSNFPNPFNPSTEISFNLTTEHTENTEIQIFNSRGQKIKTISPNSCHPEFIEGYGNLESSIPRPSTSLRMTRAGNIRTITWNGTDSNDKPCPSGVYFYKLMSGDKELAANKMLLLK